MKWFKRKNIEIELPQEFPILVKYIEEARNLMWEDEEIMKKFLEKKYPDDLIEMAFEEADNKVPLKKVERRIKMTKEIEEDGEDFDDDEELDSDEDTEDNEDSEDAEEEKEEPKPVKKKTTKKTKETTEEKEEPKTEELTNEQITNLLQQVVTGLRTHEDRMTNIESSLFRLRSI